MLQRCRIEVEGATPGHVYAQLDSWHHLVWQEVANQLNAGKWAEDGSPLPGVTMDIVDTKVHEEVVELENEGRTVDGEIGYKGRRVFSIYSGIQGPEGDPDIEQPHRTVLRDPEQEAARYAHYEGRPEDVAGVRNLEESGLPDRLSYAETGLYNILHSPEVSGAPIIDYRNFEWRIQVRFHVDGKDEPVEATGANLFDVVNELKKRREDFWRRVVPSEQTA